VPFADASDAAKPSVGFDITTRSGDQIGLVWSDAQILLSGRGGGTMHALKSIPVREAELGEFKNAMFVPGTADIVAFYSGDNAAARVFRYSPGRRMWTELLAPPTGDNSAWHKRGESLRVLGDGKTRAFYVITSASRVLRMTL
jgi:hypothetical protein